MSDTPPHGKSIYLHPKKTCQHLPVIVHLLMGWMFEIKKISLTSKSPAVQEGKRDLLQKSRDTRDVDAKRGVKAGRSGDSEWGASGARTR